MSSYFGKYNTSGDVLTALENGELLKPYVALVDESEVDYDSKSIDYASKPLTLRISEAGTIRMLGRANTTYSLNDGDFTYLPAYSYTTINVVSGDKIIFKNTDTTYGATFSGSTAGFEVFGNINFYNNSTSATDCENMFATCTGLTSAENLILPATTLSNNCYKGMFQGCISLIKAPSILPATTLAKNCYTLMFAGCTSLTKAPELPATTLAQSCYGYMFQNCTSLTKAPSILPATTLITQCYEKMFQNCTSLTGVPSNYLPATTVEVQCYDNMFNGCTLLTQAPELPATTLASYCYYQMFYNCSNLNYIKCLATDISASRCTQNWVKGVSATGTFVTPSTTNWGSGNDGIPRGWTRVNSE